MVGPQIQGPTGELRTVVAVYALRCAATVAQLVQLAGLAGFKSRILALPAVKSLLGNTQLTNDLRCRLWASEGWKVGWRTNDPLPFQHGHDAGERFRNELFERQ